MLWLFNTETKKLTVYQLLGKRLDLLFARDVRHENDPKLLQWTARGYQQSPSEKDWHPCPRVLVPRKKK